MKFCYSIRHGGFLLKTPTIPPKSVPVLGDYYSIRGQTNRTDLVMFKCMDYRISVDCGPSPL